MKPQENPLTQGQQEPPPVVDPNAPIGSGFITGAKELFAKHMNRSDSGDPPPLTAKPGENPSEPAPAPKVKADPYERLISGEPAAPVSTPAPEADEPDPAGLSEANKPHWNKVKEKAKAEKARADAAEARAKELELKYNPTEVEALRKREREKDERLAILDLENREEFKFKYDRRRDGLLNLAKLAGGEHGDKLVEILKYPDSAFRKQQLSSIMSDLDIVDQARLGGILNGLDTIQAERTAELAIAKQSIQAIDTAKKNDAERKQQARSTASEKAFLDEITRWSDPVNGVPALQERPGDETWNAQVAEARNIAKQIYSGSVNDLGEMARHSIKAAAFTQVVRQAQAQGNRITELEAEVASLSAAQPGPSVGRKAQPGGKDAPKEEGFLAGITRVARQSGFR